MNNKNFPHVCNGTTFQRSLVAVETDKEKLETDLLKLQEKSEMMQSQVEKTQKDRQNLQSEMEILLDRINKLSDMLDKARVSHGAAFIKCGPITGLFFVYFHTFPIPVVTTISIMQIERE